MPRSIHPDLWDCLRRPNPNTYHHVEVSKPDVGRILRRPEEWVEAPTLVSTALGDIAVGANGGLQLAPEAGTLATFAGNSSSFDLNKEDPSRRLKGLEWIPKGTFNRAVLRAFTARVKNLAGAPYQPAYELQIYRAIRTPGVKQKFNADNTQIISSTDFTEWTFTPLLATPARVTANLIAYDGASEANVTFDLTPYALVVENTANDATRPDQVGELPRYYFSLRALNGPNSTGKFQWRVDTTTARSNTVGDFARVFWARDDDTEEWTRQVFADVPNCSIVVDTYDATAQAVYMVDLGSVAGPDSTGRIVFERGEPRNASAALAISTTGSAGPWTVVTDGDVVTTKQRIYHLRVTLTSDASARVTPSVGAAGVEFREPVDVSVEGVPQWPVRTIETPLLTPSIPEGNLRIVRDGVRDYLDKATQLASKSPTPKLEVDIYLASRHPAVPRSKWLRLERLRVVNRVPTATSEAYGLLSYASVLKRPIPDRAESLNSVHTVSGGDASKIIVSEPLPVTSGTLLGNEYDGKGYFIRVRSTSTDIPVGFIQTIQGNTGGNQLDFVPSLPEALAAGDVIEVHSGQYNTVPISWRNEDPADVWEALLDYRGIPAERIGWGSLPRGGKPPRVTDRAPGDAATQAKLKVSNRIADPEDTDKLLDQISFIMGGATVEIGGQICFVQIYPLRDLAGNVTVPLPSITATLDVRDYKGLQTPSNVEQRASVVRAGYGVNNASASPDLYPVRSTVVADADAVAWLSQQDLEQVGTSEIPSEIARWLYNSGDDADEGLYLSSLVAAQVVYALSTGHRIWPYTSVEQRPDILPGDTVVLITDQYTDYDPASGYEIRGPQAVRAVIVEASGDGRQFSAFVQGLAGSFTGLTGGKADLTPGSTAEDRVAALYGLLNFRVISESTTTITYGWDRGALVSQVWAGFLSFDRPLPAEPWPAVAATVEPLPAAQDFIEVPQPGDKKVILLQVEPRDGDLVPGPIARATIEAAPAQPPIIDTDSSETSTTGTLWWRVQERGKLVESVLVETQTGDEDPSGFVPPLRTQGAYSYVKRRHLAAGEYEHDVRLHDTRNSVIIPRFALSGGEVMPLIPYSFDRNNRPQKMIVQVIGTVLTAIGDAGDTKSVRIQKVGGVWERWNNGPGIVVDVEQMQGDGGQAPQDPATTAQYLITFYGAAKEYVQSDTLFVTDIAIVKGSGVVSGSEPRFENAIADGPAADGSHTVTITLDADSAPAGYTTRVRERHNDGSGWTADANITSALAPALGAPPVDPTAYTWSGLPSGYNRTPKGAPLGVGAKPLDITLTVDILNGSGVPVDTKTIDLRWYYGGVPSTDTSDPIGPITPDPVLPTYTPTPGWWDGGVFVTAPAEGSKNVTIQLQASDAIGTVKLWARWDDSGGFTVPIDIASLVSPAVTTPPILPTVYTFSGLAAIYAKDRTAPVSPFKFEVQAEIWKDGVLVSVVTVSDTWTWHDTRI